MADDAMIPTSHAQFEATSRVEVAAPEDLDDDTAVIAVPTGIPFVVSTLCYVLRDRTGAAHVIDPGVDTLANLDLLRGELRRRGIDRVATVTATHLHPDHVGLVARLREETGAQFLLGRVEAGTNDAPWRSSASREAVFDEWGVPAPRRDEMLAIPESAPVSAQPDALLDDGDELPIPGRSVRAIVTPGHTPGHLCFSEFARRRVFTGDHVLPHINPGLGLGHPFDGNPTSLGIAALEAIAALDASDGPGGAPLEALPGHGYRFTGLAARATAIVAHHRRRTAEVAAVLAQEPDATVWEVASRVHWTAGWDGLGGFHRLSALAQTVQHVERARELNAEFRA